MHARELKGPGPQVPAALFLQGPGPTLRPGLEEGPSHDGAIPSPPGPPAAGPPPPSDDG